MYVEISGRNKHQILAQKQKLFRTCVLTVI